jgi:hypothetical protein
MRYAALFLATALWVTGAAQQPAPAVHFVNGLWFDGNGFAPADWYSVQGTLTHRPVKSAETVDLHGGYVVPPFGDAHEHNFDSSSTTRNVVAQYLRDGIFYAQGMTNDPAGAAAVVAAGLVNQPGTVEVTYAQGGLTAPNGHPKEVYESLANGFYYPSTAEQRAIVINGHKREGGAYWEIATLADLDAKWPRILAARPQLIKIYVCGSEHFAQPTPAEPQLGKGLDPALIAPIVERAHAAGLKVAAHVDTTTDVHNAVAGGVDELGHMPGYALSATEDKSVYRIADADIALMARRGVKVQATAGIYLDERTPPADAAARRPVQIDNLSRLKRAGVTVLVGSDRYGTDSLHEADYLQGLGVFSNLGMLLMWSVATPQDVFPLRQIGQLEGGYEASFLVLDGDPIKDWSATHRIVDRWKQGRRVVVPDRMKQ